MSTKDKNEATKDQEEEVQEMLDAVDDTDPVETPEEAPTPKKSEMDLKVAAVVPIHQVPGVQAKRGRGRPKKIRTQPTADDLAYHAAMQQAQTEYVDADALVQTASNRHDAMASLSVLKERLARMAATLEFRRIEDEKYGGKDSPQIISRQAAILKEIAAIDLKLKEMSTQTLDVYSEPVQKLMGMFIGKIQAIAQDCLPKEHFDVLFNRLEVDLDKWEEEAENLLR